jgi:hypothetical protein
MTTHKDISWWYWLAMALLLATGLAGLRQAFLVAIALGVVQSLHYLGRHRRFMAFPVQVRVSYLGLLVFGWWDPYVIWYWIQLAGTMAMVTMSYCPLARFLSLMPWNRQEPFTLALLRRTVLSAPVKGSILQGLPAK